MIIILISAYPQSLPTGFILSILCGTNQQAQKSLTGFKTCKASQLNNK
jgi:hypothetical protein